MTILVHDPLVAGYSHVPTNSGFLATALLAFPEQTVLFCAEPKHLTLVRQHLQQKHFTQTTNYSERIDTTSRHQPIWRQRYHALASVLTAAMRQQIDTVVLTALDGIGIAILKALLASSAKHLRVFVVMHGALTNIVADKPSVKTTLFRSLMRVGNLSLGMNYIVIAPTIYRATLAIAPALQPALHYLDHPHLFSQETLPQTTFPTNGISFGFLGHDTPIKGFPIFAQLAQDITKQLKPAQQGKVHFKAIGHSTRNPSENSALSLLMQADFLAAEDYAAHIGAIDYTIFPYSAHHYRVRASASILDTFEHFKPPIVFNIPLFKDYYERMGNIGYLCDNYPQMLEKVLHIIEEPPVSEYQSQQRAIAAQRRLFTPEVLAPQFKKIIG